MLVQSATAFTVVKYLGAAYLCWIGIKSLIAAWRGVETSDAVRPTPRRRTLANAYFEGLLINALNPKVSMFSLAAFPQFMTLGETTASASFLRVFVHSAIHGVWFGAMVLLMLRRTTVTRSDRLQRWLKDVTGVVFTRFGAKLASYKPSL